MKTLNIDIETYSSVDLIGRGVYNYAASGDFEVLLFAYSADDEEVKIVDLAQGEHLPHDVIDALLDPMVEKRAFNAQFERVCLSAMLRRMGLVANTSAYPAATADGEFLNPEGWSCTRVLASACGYPGSLAFVCKALGIGSDKAKMKEGGRLIRLFSMPQRKNGKLLRTIPQDNAEGWATFKEYCKRDVVAEMEVRKRVCEKMPLGVNRTFDAYTTDQLINDRGVAVDLDFVKKAAAMVSERKDELEERVRMVTGKQGTLSTALKKWLSRQIGVPSTVSLSQNNVERIREALEKKFSGLSDQVAAFDAYMELQVKSVAKYGALIDFTCADGRLRGGYYYCGARTGRWTSKGVQLHNLPRRAIGTQTANELRKAVKGGNYDEMKALHLCVARNDDNVGSVMQALGQLVRTAFVPEEGKRLVSFDFKTIEPRILAWLAGQEWMLRCFADGGDIYMSTAERIFTEKPDRSHRDKAKVATIALGYGGGDEPLAAMAKQMGVELGKHEAVEIVKRWRKGCDLIVKLWRTLEGAALDVVLSSEQKKKEQWMVPGMIAMSMVNGALCVRIPGNRVMRYPKARVARGSEVKSMVRSSAVCYDGASAAGTEWVTHELYGGKLTENVVQAIARDVLASALMVLEECGYKVVMHTHDEVTLEVGTKAEAVGARRIFEHSSDWMGLPGGTPSDMSTPSLWYSK